MGKNDPNAKTPLAEMGLCFCTTCIKCGPPIDPWTRNPEFEQCPECNKVYCRVCYPVHNPACALKEAFY